MNFNNFYMENKTNDYLNLCPDHVNNIFDNDVNNLLKNYNVLINEISNLKKIIKDQNKIIDELKSNITKLNKRTLFF